VAEAQESVDVSQDKTTSGTPMQVFDLGAALRDQVPLGVINKELANRKNFDYDAAFSDVKQFRKNELLQGGLSEQNIVDEDLTLFADEILLEKLSDGAYAREADPTKRGMMQGMLVDLPAGMGFIKGAVEGFQRTPGPIPLKVVGAGIGAMGLSTAGYAPGEIFLRGDPTGLTDYEGIYPSEPLPSQRAEIESARTYTGTLLSLLTLGSFVRQGAVDLGSDAIARNIENMAPGLKRSFSKVGEKIVRGTERISEAMGKPFAVPTTKAQTAGAIGKAAVLSTAPAAGAYLAETADPYNPLTRVAAEVGVSAIPTQRIAAFVTDKTAGTLLRSLRNIFSKSGREDTAGKRFVASLEALDAKYADVKFNRETFAADLDEALANSPLEALVERVNAQLPEGRQQLIVPPLTIAQRTAGTKKQVGEGTTKEINPLIGLEALDRGLRKTNTGTGSYGELSNQLYQDFKLFSARLMEELLIQAQGNPRALAEAAQIQEAVFSAAILHNLEAAKEAAIQRSQKVEPPMRRKTQSELMVTYVNDALNDVSDATDMLYDRAKDRLAGQNIQPSFTLEAIQELQDNGVTSFSPIVSEILRAISPDSSNLEADLNRVRGIEEETFATLSRLQFQAQAYLNTLPTRVEEGLQPLLTSIENISPEEQITVLRRELDRRTTPGVKQNRDIKNEASYLRKLIPVATAQAEFDSISARVAEARSQATNQQAAELSLSEILDYRRRLSRANRNNVNQNQAAESYHMSVVEEGIIRDLEALSGGSSLLNEGPQAYASFENLLQSLEEQGMEGVQAGLILLRKANAFNVAKHDVFTRTFIGDVRQKDSKGRMRINPQLALQKLFAGSSDEVSIRLQEVEDAINWINTGGFERPSRALTQDEIARFSDSAVARFGTYQASKDDLLKQFFKSAIDSDPNSPTFNTVDPRKAQRFIEKNEEALGPLFPDVFRDIKSGIEGRIKFDDLLAEQARIETDLTNQTLLSQFRGVYDNPGKRIRDIVGTPQNPLVNSPQNLQQLLDEVKSVTSGKSADVRDKTNKALVYAILDSAYIYAGGRNPSGEIDFQKFRQYLFDPLDGREGDSVAKLLEKNNIITQESFKDYQTLINQSAEIAQVMRSSGPQSVEKLQDKSALLANIVIRGLGAIGGNVVVNRLKGIFGNVPGASMSVAQTTSNATAELGLNMPAMKVQDIYIRAMTEKDLMQILLTKQPKSEKKAIEYFRSLPAIFYTSGVRTGIEEVQRTETGKVPVNYAEEVYRDVVPQPAPTPQPVATSQAPTPQPVATSQSLVASSDGLWNRVLQQESGNRQTDSSGRVLRSKAGAIGISQVMPSTAMDPGYGVPSIFDMARQNNIRVEKESRQEAERLLGIQELNEQFGRAYFDMLAQRYEGDPVRQLIAYNAGIRVADRYNDNPTTLPRETQGYITNILGVEEQAVKQAAAPAPQPPIAQAAPPAPPAPAPVSPQSLQRAAQVLGPQDDIGMLASEMLMRQRPA